MLQLEILKTLALFVGNWIRKDQLNGCSAMLILARSHDIAATNKNQGKTAGTPSISHA